MGLIFAGIYSKFYKDLFAQNDGIEEFCEDLISQIYPNHNIFAWTIFAKSWIITN